MPTPCTCSRKAPPTETGPEPTALQARLIELLRRRGALRGRQIDHSIPHANWRAAMQPLVRRGRVLTQNLLPAPTVQPKFIRTVQLSSPAEAAERAMPELGRAGSAALETAPGCPAFPDPRAVDGRHRLGLRPDRGYAGRPAAAGRARAGQLRGERDLAGPAGEPRVPARPAAAAHPRPGGRLGRRAGSHPVRRGRPTARRKPPSCCTG